MKARRAPKPYTGITGTGPDFYKPMSGRLEQHRGVMQPHGIEEQVEHETDRVKTTRRMKMGYVNVQVGGSFVGQFGMESTTEQFSALEHGHADAVARAIQYLAEVVLPRATALDHRLASEGAKPNGGFTPKRITLEPGKEQSPNKEEE